MDGGDDGNYVDVTHEKGSKKDAKHDKGPDCARPEICLLLFVLGLDFFFGGLLLLAKVSIGARDIRQSCQVRLNKNSSLNLTSLTVSSVAWAFVLADSPSSLMSLKLERRPSEPLVCPFAFLWGNLTPLLDRPMVSRACAVIETTEFVGLR